MRWYEKAGLTFIVVVVLSLAVYGISTSTFTGNIEVNGWGYFNQSPATCPTGTYMTYSDMNESTCTAAVKTTGDTRLTGEYAVTGGLNTTGESTFATSSGNVGIGTTAPSQKLDVIGASEFNGDVYLKMDDADYMITDRVSEMKINTTIGNRPSEIGLYASDNDGTDNILFRTYAVGGTDRYQARFGWDSSNQEFKIDTESAGTSPIGNLSLYTEGNRGQLYLTSDGNVGIGTTTPTSKLHVDGEAKITGISGDGTGSVVCIKSDGTLGTCTDQPDTSGDCTCI